MQGFFAEDQLTQLAFSIYQNKGVFALMLGSGLSRSAGIPTGWEITTDLIRQVGLAQGGGEQPDWGRWFRDQTGAEPNYSALLEELASSPEERRSILHQYIEPSDTEREEGRKLPTKAHRAIAELVRGGYVRVVVTTNFDRLLENALRDVGIEPTIVSSVDALAGAEPITHTKCFILKIHGDYKDTRILNTETELNDYHAKMNTLLDKIFDEYGFVFAGWSGEWDHALRAAILRAPNRRYSHFWAARGVLGAGAQSLIDQRRARVIPITDADTFFVSLEQRVVALEQSQRRNPLDVEVLAGTAKRFLAKSEFRIQLDEMVAQATTALMAQLDGSDFDIPHQFDPQEFNLRVKRLEAASEGIATVCGILGRWGSGDDFDLVSDVIQSLYGQSQKLRSGLVSHLGIRSYPALLAFVSYGLGATRAQRWPELHNIFNLKLERPNGHHPQRVVETLFLWEWEGQANDVWNRIEGLDRHKTPLSDHLQALFARWAPRFVGLVSDFEGLYDRFELLGSLAHFEGNDMDDLRTSFASKPRDAFAFMPVGRVGYRTSSAKVLITEMSSDPLKAALKGGGFADRSTDMMALFEKNFTLIAGRISWR